MAFNEAVMTSLTVQEMAIMSDRSYRDRALNAKKYWTPDSIVEGKSIDEVNALRQESGYLPSLNIGTFCGDDDTVMSLEPLDPVTGETVRDPQVMRFDFETQQVLGVSEELTKKFREGLRRAEQESLKKGMPYESASYFLRESPAKIEGVKSIGTEGMKKV